MSFFEIPCFFISDTFSSIENTVFRYRKQYFLYWKMMCYQVETIFPIEQFGKSNRALSANSSEFTTKIGLNLKNKCHLMIIKSHYLENMSHLFAKK